ncbi:hypothetical protein ACIBTP_17795 [Streptomyces avidinii]|uniref:hypothetical protein n=1 Tax=Streptomyces avidinii TaxID=1895 RepID=UPI00378E138D
MRSSRSSSDFTVRAGNHVRSVEWLEAPARQIGRRLLDVQPGAAAGGLIDALAGALDTGRVLRSYAVDYTEQRSDGLHLLSGETTWSEGLHANFRTEQGRPLSLVELCGAALLDDAPRLAKTLTALLDGELDADHRGPCSGCCPVTSTRPSPSRCAPVIF